MMQQGQTFSLQQAHSPAYDANPPREAWSANKTQGSTPGLLPVGQQSTPYTGHLQTWLQDAGKQPGWQSRSLPGSRPLQVQGALHGASMGPLADMLPRGVYAAPERMQQAAPARGRRPWSAQPRSMARPASASPGPNVQSPSPGYAGRGTAEGVADGYRTNGSPMRRPLSAPRLGTAGTHVLMQPPPRQVEKQAVALVKNRDAGRLAVEWLQVKSQLHQLQQDLKQVSTEKLRLEEQLAEARTNLVKAEELMNDRERELSPTQGLTQMYRTPSTTALVSRLKERVKALTSERDDLQAEVEANRVRQRATRLSELQSQTQMLRQELGRQQASNTILAAKLSDSQLMTQDAMAQAAKAAAQLKQFLKQGEYIPKAPMRIAANGSLSAGRVGSTLAALRQSHTALMSQAQLLRALFPPQQHLTMEQLDARARAQNSTRGAGDVLRELRVHLKQLTSELRGLPGSMHDMEDIVYETPSSACPLDTAQVTQVVADYIRRLRTFTPDMVQGDVVAQVELESMSDVMGELLGQVARLTGTWGTPGHAPSQQPQQAPEGQPRSNPLYSTEPAAVHQAAWGIMSDIGEDDEVDEEMLYQEGQDEEEDEEEEEEEEERSESTITPCKEGPASAQPATKDLSSHALSAVAEEVDDSSLSGAQVPVKQASSSKRPSHSSQSAGHSSPRQATATQGATSVSKQPSVKQEETAEKDKSASLPSEGSLTPRTSLQRSASQTLTKSASHRSHASSSSAKPPRVPEAVAASKPSSEQVSETQAAPEATSEAASSTPNQVLYVVRVDTGVAPGSATNAARVLVTLVGEAGRSTELVLPRHDPKLPFKLRFGRSAVDNLEVEAADVGELNAIIVRLEEDASQSLSWQLDSVTITRTDTGRTWTFDFAGWLGTSYGYSHRLQLSHAYGGEEEASQVSCVTSRQASAALEHRSVSQSPSQASLHSNPKASHASRASDASKASDATKARSHRSRSLAQEQATGSARQSRPGSKASSRGKEPSHTSDAGSQAAAQENEAAGSVASGSAAVAPVKESSGSAKAGSGKAGSVVSCSPAGSAASSVIAPSIEAANSVRSHGSGESKPSQDAGTVRSGSHAGSIGAGGAQGSDAESLPSAIVFQPESDNDDNGEGTGAGSQVEAHSVASAPQATGSQQGSTAQSVASDGNQQDAGGADKGSVVSVPHSINEEGQMEAEEEDLEAAEAADEKGDENEQADDEEGDGEGMEEVEGGSEEVAEGEEQEDSAGSVADGVASARDASVTAAAAGGEQDGGAGSDDESVQGSEQVKATPWGEGGGSDGEGSVEEEVSGEEQEGDGNASGDEDAEEEEEEEEEGTEVEDEVGNGGEGSEEGGEEGGEASKELTAASGEVDGEPQTGFGSTAFVDEDPMVGSSASKEQGVSGDAQPAGKASRDGAVQAAGNDEPMKPSSMLSDLPKLPGMKAGGAAAAGFGLLSESSSGPLRSMGSDSGKGAGDVSVDSGKGTGNVSADGTGSVPSRSTSNAALPVSADGALPAASCESAGSERNTPVAGGTSGSMGTGALADLPKLPGMKPAAGSPAGSGKLSKADSSKTSADGTSATAAAAADTPLPTVSDAIQPAAPSPSAVQVTRTGSSSRPASGLPPADPILGAGWPKDDGGSNRSSGSLHPLPAIPGASKDSVEGSSSQAAQATGVQDNMAKEQAVQDEEGDGEEDEEGSEDEDEEGSEEGSEEEESEYEDDSEEDEDEEGEGEDGEGEEGQDRTMPELMRRSTKPRMSSVAEGDEEGEDGENGSGERRGSRQSAATTNTADAPAAADVIADGKAAQKPTLVPAAGAAVHPAGAVGFAQAIPIRTAAAAAADASTVQQPAGRGQADGVASESVEAEQPAVQSAPSMTPPSVTRTMSQAASMQTPQAQLWQSPSMRQPSLGSQPMNQMQQLMQQQFQQMQQWQRPMPYRNNDEAWKSKLTKL